MKLPAIEINTPPDPTAHRAFEKWISECPFGLTIPVDQQALLWLMAAFCEGWTRQGHLAGVHAALNAEWER